MILACVTGLLVTSCDLQPKIASIPDSVGDFISSRYPALLADPATQPEIYNSAATDYGVYASPELYGSVTEDDYVLYSSISDYIIPPQAEPSDVPDTTESVTETVTDATDTMDTSKIDTTEVLAVPMYGQLELTSGTQINTVIVSKGDTLYSIAKKYNMKIEDLARINKISAPYNLKIGQLLHLTSQDADTGVVDKQSVIKPLSESSVKDVSKSQVQTVPIETQQIVIKHPTPTTTRVELEEITVAPGETLYSISRRYSVPVNDLAVMNDISAPFTLFVGQRIKVPNLEAPSIHVATSVVSAPVSKSGRSPVSETLVVNTPLAKTQSEKVSNTKKADAKKNEDVCQDKQDKKNELNKSQKTKKTESTQDKSKSVDAPITKNAKSSLYGGNDKQNNKSAQKTKMDKSDTKTTTDKVSNKKSSKTSKQTKDIKSGEKQKISSDPNKALPKMVARSSSKFSWPVRGKILSHFGAKSQGLFNDGINISATRGTTVKSAENGVVAYAGNEVKGMGDLVIIQHADGWMTVYAHMESMAVRRGAKVSVGQKIGTVGATGRVDKPQLHFEIRKGTKAYNPMKYLKQ